MPSILASIQQEIADRLLADPFFAAIPILVEQPREIGFELQAGIAAAGTYGVVSVPQATVSAPNAPGPIFDPVEIAVRFRENIPVGTGSRALEAAETALALLHLYRPVTFNEVICVAPQALVRVEEANGTAYEIRVRTQACAAYEIPQLGAPEIEVTGVALPLTVTLSSAQPGAAIFYTLDGSQPSPRSPEAMLYKEPLVVEAEVRLRARVWLAGYLTSEETRRTLE